MLSNFVIAFPPIPSRLCQISQSFHSQASVKNNGEPRVDRSLCPPALLPLPSHHPRLRHNFFISANSDVPSYLALRAIEAGLRDDSFLSIHCKSPTPIPSSHTKSIIERLTWHYLQKLKQASDGAAQPSPPLPSGLRYPSVDLPKKPPPHLTYCSTSPNRTSLLQATTATVEAAAGNDNPLSPPPLRPFLTKASTRLHQTLPTP